MIPIAVLVVSMSFVVRAFGADALSGGSQVALLASSAIGATVAIAFFGVRWRQIEEAVEGNIRSIAIAILILLMIGAISGSWMTSGVVPTLIYYGLKIITPGIFLLAACVICALVAVVTGSSWTTIATVGVALTGIGTAQGYAPGWIAGAIISGAYFGDKVSPLSDTTVLAASTAGTPLFEHIRYMMVTTVPSFITACIVFLTVSLTHGGSDSFQAMEISTALSHTFNISGWLLIIPLITMVLIMLKVPALLTLACAAAMAGIVAPFAQPDVIGSIAGDGGSALKGVFISLYGETSVATGNEALDSLVQTRGMAGMLETIFLIICATTFGGVLTGSGMVQSLTEAMTRGITGPKSSVSATVATGITSNILMGDQYLSIILAARLFKKLYDKNGLESRLLSRSVEDSATVTSVLIPWNSCGMTQATVLRVPTLDYLPYCIFNLLSPLMSILVAAIGYKIVRKKVAE